MQRSLKDQHHYAPAAVPLPCHCTATTPPAGVKVGGKWGASSRLFPAAMMRLLRIRLQAARAVVDASAGEGGSGSAAGVAARKRVSQQQAEAVCAKLLARAASLSATDLETVTELVDEVGFEVEDLTSVLDAINVVAGSLERRRGAQTLHPQIHHYFTASEWRIMQNGVGNNEKLRQLSR